MKVMVPKKEARDQMVRALDNLMEEIPTEHATIEWWLMNGAQFLSDSLRGKRHVDPTHPIFRINFD